MDVPQLLAEIDRELSAQGSPERAVQERAYLKSRLDHYGASVPAMRAVAKGVAKRRPPLGGPAVRAPRSARPAPPGRR
jgi:hypothetical protein